VTQVKDLLDRYHADLSARSPWMQFWQRIYDIHAPNRADFTEDHSPGQTRTQEVYDATPRLAARALATALDGLLKAKSSRWFWLTVKDRKLLESHEIQLYLELKRELMWQAVYDVSARFAQRSSEVDLDLVLAGIGYLWIGMNSNKTGLAFKSFHPSTATIRENADGVVDSSTLTVQYTARQAVQRFGVEKIGRRTREALTGTAPQKAKKFKFVQLILPRDDRDAKKMGNLNMPFASVWIDVDSEHKISESGFEEFPLAIPRWETSPGDVYPRGPAAYSAPDARTLNTITKTLLVGGQMAVDPPKWVAADGMLSPVRTFPGGLTVIDGEVAREMKGPPIGQLDLAGNIPLGREMQNDYRIQIEKAFFKDIFDLPQEGPEMTATEIVARKEQFLRNIGPVFGRLEADYIGHITMRVHNLMERAGAFPPPPADLEDVPIQFEYISPIQQAKRQLDAAGFVRTMEILGPIASLKPEIMDNFDTDAVARDAPEYAGMPQKWIMSQEEVDATRQQRAEAQQAQQQLDAAEQGASAIEKLGGAAASAASAGVSGDAAE